MPKLERPDGAVLHWEARGEGPLVVLVLGIVTRPDVFDALTDDLRRDHRVLTYDPRGTGDSTRTGPYDLETDAADLAGVCAEAGGDGVALAVANGMNVAFRVATRSPELLRAVLVPGGPPLPIGALEGIGGFASSASVVEVLMEQARHDPRGALRALIASVNTQLDEAGIRERLERQLQYMSVEAGLARGEAWVADRSVEAPRALGDRLFILHHPHDPWLTPEALPVARELLPDAHIIQVEEGPLSRPDLTAAHVRAITQDGY